MNNPHKNECPSHPLQSRADRRPHRIRTDRRRGGRGFRHLGPHGAQVGGTLQCGRARSSCQSRERAGPVWRAACPSSWIWLILWFRRAFRLTAARIAAILGLARSTVARWLTRASLGRLTRLDPPEPVRRYQCERPGELIHLDTKKLGRFDHPGHHVTGTRRGCRNRSAGWDFVHVAVDDATRLAHVDVLPDKRKATTTAFLLRAIRGFRSHGIRVERVRIDNGAAYRSRPFRKALRWLANRHIVTRPLYRPSCANGPTALPTHPQTHETQTCREGLTGSTAKDHTRQSKASRRSMP